MIEHISRAKIEPQVPALGVELHGDNLEIKVISDDTLHQETVELLGPLVFVHVSLDYGFLISVSLHCILFNIFA